MRINKYYFLWKKRCKGNNIGEKIIWFVRGSLFKYFCQIIYKDEIKRSILDKKFDEHSFFLQYCNKYPDKVVFLRMPINDKITVLDVERYF